LDNVVVTPGLRLLPVEATAPDPAIVFDNADLFLSFFNAGITT
jgi:hypothetical protein